MFQSEGFAYSHNCNFLLRFKTNDIGIYFLKTFYYATHMFAFKKHYFLIIESVQDINLSQIKKRNKFTIIYRNLGQYEPKEEVTAFRKNCKAKDIKFFVANDINLAQSLNADGIYLSARNNSLQFLKFKRKNFKIIGVLTI